MKKNIINRLSFLIGMPFTGILLMILIISMAIATFIESAQGTNTAWAAIYDSWWFESLFALVLINLIGSVITNKLYKRAKITVFVFHMSFVLIILGGGISRFFGTEGMMHIREDSMSGTIVSSDAYMDIKLQDGESELEESKKVRLSVLTPKKFKWKGSINGKKVKIKSIDYIQNASAQYVASPGGQPYMQLVLLSGGQHNVGLSNGETAKYPGITIGFNSREGSDLEISSQNDTLYASSKYGISISAMGSEELESYKAGVTIPLLKGKLYTVNSARFALQRYMSSAKLQFVRSGNSGQSMGMDVARLEVEVNGMRSDLFVPSMANNIGNPNKVQMGSTSVSCAYGSKNILLPFVIQLKDFKIDRYPGSNSPSSFESDVVLIDVEKNLNEEYNIYMNNVLKHRGYRFYQSSYDQDELGTILSVNKDFAGTIVSYAGYLFLALGMMLSLFSKGTRFAFIARASGKKAVKITGLAILMLLSSSSLFSQEYPAPSKEVASAFSDLWVQGKDGRFEPINTLSNEVIRKIIKKSHFEGLNADQFLLGILAYPEDWKQAPLFEIDNPELHQLLGFKGEYVSFNDFIDGNSYLLSEVVNNAYNKRVQDRNDFDKEVMKLDDKINVFYMVQTGNLLKIFPDPGSAEGKWHSVADLLTGNEADSVGKVFLLYTQALREGDMALSSDIIRFIENYQKKNSNHLLLENKKKAEILYNKINLYQRLIKFYLLFGFALLALQFLRIFRYRKWVEYAFLIGVIHIAVAFALHTIFLLLRWYISGHAPLSNGYESMLFVSWITLMAGLIFTRRTGFATALTSILAAFALLVAHMSWMNPDITNLVPVLKSPWLSIHVTVIISGYGFLGMSMLMALINIISYAILGKRNKEKLLNVIEQVTKVNHLSLIIGLYLLTIGTFLGGVWANESWGRYWGWDPKETWALISVLVYSFIAHMHRFPGMKGNFAFNLASLIGYSSILMTYFGVNYFLGGIHSYAAGVAFVIPIWVYISILVILLLAIIANYKQKLHQSVTD